MSQFGKIRNYLPLKSGRKWYNTTMENARDKFIDEHRALFWYTPEEEKRGVSDELLVETILNDGTLDDFRGNYYPEIRNFFSLALKQYA